MGMMTRINESKNTQTAVESKIEEDFGKSICDDKLPEVKNSVLSISTIASAIANASVSAHPFQLAAMIMGLSNKSREKTEEHGEIFLNEFLSSNLENAAFDMEKYLKRTEGGNESESENFTRTDDLPCKPKNQTSVAVDFSSHSEKHAEGKQLMKCKERLHEKHMQDSSCGSNFSEERSGVAKFPEEASNLTGENSFFKKARSTEQDAEKVASGNDTEDCATKEDIYREKFSLKQFAEKTHSSTDSKTLHISKDTKQTDQVMSSVFLEPMDAESVKRPTTENMLLISSLTSPPECSTPLFISHTEVKPLYEVKDEKKQGGKMPNGNGDSAAYNEKHVTF
uniref:Uncharacterized protein n=1 Tax=Sphenodon punctatus TaxID=8508 RepID=A0A8D0H8L6_SPHPU